MKRKVAYMLFLSLCLAVWGTGSVWGQCRCCCICCDSCHCDKCDTVMTDVTVLPSVIFPDSFIVEPILTPVPSDTVVIYERKKGYLFALKTNLLFDLVTAINVEVEVPIGKRFSIAGEWMFPDWVDRETNTYCLQTNIKSLEFRTWLGNRNYRRKLTGHYIGVYGQMGDFDFQPFTEQGFRCYDLYGGGLSYGFAHTINKRKTLSLEYGIGVGFFLVDYCTYERSEDGTKLITYDGWKGDGWYILPTKLKVSLVWLIPYSVKKKVTK